VYITTLHKLKCFQYVSVETHTAYINVFPPPSVNENNKLSEHFINLGPLVFGYGLYVLGISADLAVRTSNIMN
jgi:hypothetical protein